MRTTERTTKFKRDYKRELKGKYGRKLDAMFKEVLSDLIQDFPLDEKFCDHALTGNWKDHRDCHIRPDLVLIYCRPNDTILRLVRLGSHSELDM